MKKMILTLSIALMAVISPSLVVADGTTKTEKVCTTNQYGETSCSEKTTTETVVHQPVDAAVGDFNPTLVVMSLFGAGYLAYSLSKKVGQI